jgi:hypothetical protein
MLGRIDIETNPTISASRGFANAAGSAAIAAARIAREEVEAAAFGDGENAGASDSDEDRNFVQTGVPQSSVTTPFGRGIVVENRVDGVWVVELPFADAYLQKGSQGVVAFGEGSTDFRAAGLEPVSPLPNATADALSPCSPVHAEGSRSVRQKTDHNTPDARARAEKDARRRTAEAEAMARLQRDLLASCPPPEAETNLSILDVLGAVGSLASGVAEGLLGASAGADDQSASTSGAEEQ